MEGQIGRGGEGNTPAEGKQETAMRTRTKDKEERAEVSTGLPGL